MRDNSFAPLDGEDGLSLYDYNSLWLLSLDFLYFLLPLARRFVVDDRRFFKKRYTSRKTNTFAIGLHVACGFFLIISGAAIFLLEFMGENVTVKHPQIGLAYASAGVLHSFSATVLIRKVQGERRLTVPLYVAVICVNLYNSARIIQDNTIENIQFLWFSTNTFIYVRLLGVAYMLTTSMDWHMTYTASVMGAALPTLFTLPRNGLVVIAIAALVMGGPIMENILDKRLGMRTVFLRADRDEASKGESAEEPSEDSCAESELEVGNSNNFRPSRTSNKRRDSVSSSPPTTQV
mmetsp:Transcript_10891/g.30921  ORF Transcript_10891/g.30921 Transcript_10891/m.30921 type:complete len:292 (+) Transcript_10891:154-1029(+)